jgi:hypothetical protein
VSPPDRGQLERDRAALRIQAAAVAAQQAALTEDEIRLQQRRLALEQQEAQLAAHLEDKRRRLLELRDEARQARTELQNERAGYEQRVAETSHEIACAREEIADGQRLVQTERHRLSGLRRRLKQRWHRHWAAERLAMRRRENELAGQRRALERDGERLLQDKAGLNQARLHYHGEIELGRRQLRAAWDELHHEQLAWRQQHAAQQTDLEGMIQQCRQRDAAVTEAEHRLDEQQLRWQEKRLALEKELDGLENRVANQRRKLFEQEQELARLGTMNCTSQVAPLAVSTALPSGSESSPVLLPTVVETGPPAWQLCEAEAGLQQRVQALEAIAGDLADQRMHLAEQSQRLVQMQQHWQQERDAMAEQLENIGLRLQEREQVVAARERSLSAVEGTLYQRHEEAAHLRRHLEAWQGRLTARTAAWEAERDRLLVEVQGREELAQRRLALLADVRQRWHERRRHQLERLRAERADSVNQRQEYAALREDWLARRALLDQEQRALAEQALTLEQYRQEHLSKASSPESAAERLEQLRRQWTAWTAAAQRTLTENRLALHAESVRLQEHRRAVEQLADGLAEQEGERSRRQASWEQQQMAAEEEWATLRQQLHSLGFQRDRLEQQLKELRDEVERLAGVLLEDGGAASEPIGQAA